MQGDAPMTDLSAASPRSRRQEPADPRRRPPVPAPAWRGAMETRGFESRPPRASRRRCRRSARSRRPSPCWTCAWRTAPAWRWSRRSRAPPGARGIMLTGYGNIATAVTAVKLGAVDYLSKPADADEIARALHGDAATRAPRRRTTRCAPTGCAGSTSSASTSSATTTSRRRRAGSTCTAAPCSASWPSAPRADRVGPPGGLSLRPGVVLSTAPVVASEPFDEPDFSPTCPPPCSR